MRPFNVNLSRDFCINCMIEGQASFMGHLFQGLVLYLAFGDCGGQTFAILSYCAMTRYRPVIGLVNRFHGTRCPIFSSSKATGGGSTVDG